MDNYNIKNDVEYKMNECLKDEIVKIKELVNNKLNNSKIFLFGSIAKGAYKTESDIDILILIDEEMPLKEIRGLRHDLEDHIETLKLSRDVDVKIYSEKRYLELSNSIGFEQAIIKDLVDIRSW